MRKGLRGFLDDALARTGPLAVEKSGDFPTARRFAHKLHQALFGRDKIPGSQNQPRHRSLDHNRQGSTYQSRFSVQTNGATSLGKESVTAVWKASDFPASAPVGHNPPSSIRIG